MKEQFDNKLVQKIRDTFESYDEPHDPTEWDKFSKNYFGKSRKIIPYWLYLTAAVAASMVIALVIWNPFRPSGTEPGNTSMLALESPSQQTSPHLTPGDDSKEVDGAVLADVAGARMSPYSATQTHAARSEEQPLQMQGKASGSGNSGLPSNTKRTPILASVPNSESAGKENTNIPSQSVESAAVALAVPPTVMQTEEAENEIQNWLAEAGEEEEKEEVDAKNPLKLGVLVAPQTISNSTQNLNFGAGLMSEISFSRRLRLDLGIGFARQNLSPESGMRGNYSADFAGNESYKASMLAGNYINSSTELSFGQIEIPLNMKYSVIQKKSSDFYLVTGLSNMFYVNQEKVTTYNTVSFASNSMNASPQVLNATSLSESPGRAEGQVDIGQLINLGLGFEQNLKNGTSISFEPFYKFSLGEQTFVNQQFAIGGINLRMNFQLKK